MRNEYEMHYKKKKAYEAFEYLIKLFYFQFL